MFSWTCATNLSKNRRCGSCLIIIQILCKIPTLIIFFRFQIWNLETGNNEEHVNTLMYVRVHGCVSQFMRSSNSVNYQRLKRGSGMQGGRTLMEIYSSGRTCGGGHIHRRRNTYRGDANMEGSTKGGVTHTEGTHI